MLDISLLRNDPEKVRENIRKEWMKNMSWGPIADDYVKCYKSKIQTKNRSGKLLSDEY